MYNKTYQALKAMAEFVQNEELVWDHWKGHIKFLDNKDGVYKFLVDDGQLIVEFLDELGENELDAKLVRHYADSTLGTWINSRRCWKIKQFRQVLGEVYLK